MSRIRILLFAAVNLYVGGYVACLSALVLVLGAVQAQACACCTNTAWRYVNVDKLDKDRLAQFEQVTFAKEAKLMLGEADDDGIKGVEDASEDYQLVVTRSGNRMIFAFRDEKGRAGALVLTMPATVSIFEGDPRDTQDKGNGPPLYKEWKLTANAAGDGLFKAAIGAGQRMTLVLHGRGNGCTSYEQFSHWSLLVYGKADTFTMYGALDSFAR
jgi:hypothetical protein